MNRWVVLALLIPWPALATDLSGNDKKLHMAASGGIAYAAGKTFDNPLVGILAGLTAGYVKEATDPIFSHDDLKADAIGAVVGGLLTVRIEF